MGGGGRRAGEGDRENMRQKGGEGQGMGGKGDALKTRGMEVMHGGALFKCGKWGEKKESNKEKEILSEMGNNRSWGMNV